MAGADVGVRMCVLLGLARHDEPPEGDGMTAIDPSRWRDTDHSRAARMARLVVAAERRYARRARAYEQGRRSTELVDTQRLALLLVDADRLVRGLVRVRP